MSAAEKKRPQDLSTDVWDQLNKKQKKSALRERAKTSNDPQVLRDRFYHSLMVQEMPLCVGAPTSTSQAGSGNGEKVSDRYLIECCTSEESRLGAIRYTEDGCKVDRITIKHDFTTEASLKKSIEAAKRAAEEGYYLALWGSLPCTAGCPWQHLNKRHRTARKKIAQHMVIFRKLITNFHVLAATVHELGGDVHFEWPKGCTLWRHPQVTKMVHSLAMNTVNFDGCALNMRSSRGGLIRKPWTLATTPKAMLDLLGRH